MNAENFLKRSQEAKMSSNDSGGLQRLHFGQCTPPLLLSKWTVVNQSLLKHDSSILLGIQMETKITVPRLQILHSDADFRACNFVPKK